MALKRERSVITPRRGSSVSPPPAEPVETLWAKGNPHAAPGVSNVLPSPERGLFFLERGQAVLSGVDQFDAEVDCVAGGDAASSRFPAAAHSNASFNITNRSLGSSASLAACIALHANELNSSTVLMMALPLNTERLVLR